MAKTSTELLQGILKTVSSIDNNMKQDKKKSSTSSGTGASGGGMKDAVNMSGALLKFSLVKPKTTERFLSFMKDVLKVSKDFKDGKGFKVFSEGMIGISKSLPDLVKGLSDLSRIRPRRVNAALGTLDRLYEFMTQMGSAGSYRRINRAINLFSKLGKALRKIAKPLRMLSSFLTYLGLSFVVFAAGIVASSLILKLSSPMGILGAVVGTVLVLVGVLALLTVASKFLKPGIKTIKGIGTGFMFLSLGLLGFTLSLLLIASAMQAGLGFGGILKSLAILGGVIIGVVGLFALLGYAGKFVKKGVMTTALIGIGLVTMALAIGFVATTAAAVSGIFTKNTGDGGLGIIGGIFLGATALFALLGIPVVAGLVALGAATAIAVSGSLYILAVSVQKLVDVSSKVPKGFGKSLGAMIGGVLEGMLIGIASLTEGKTGVKGLVAFAKNSAKIFAVTGILMAASISLSMFARALTAFANLSEMRPIVGHKENGEPIFGDKVNITNVGANISTTIHDFLIALISSTDGLTKEQAGAIKKMGRALTGKRGILQAIIQFADVLKLYAQFGEKNEIGYVTFDEKGNEIRKSVPVDTVVTNIISSFTTFTSKLFSRSEDEFGDGEEAGISGKQKRRMKRMSKALNGKNGILEPIIKFSETLQVFAKFGKNNQIPILNEEGKPTGEFLTMNDIADNIVGALTSFSDTLATKLEKGQAKDASKALDKYDKMVNKLEKLSKSMDGLTRMSASIGELATNIGLLGENLNSLNVDKLGDLSNVSAAYLEKTNSFSNSNQRIMEKSTDATTRPGYSSGGGSSSTSTSNSFSSGGGKPAPKEAPINWDQVSAQIGSQVGAQVSSALKNGQFIFEFDTTKAGGIYYWKPA